MTNHQFVTVTRTLVKRALTDIERKIVAALVSGGAGYGFLQILAAYHVNVPANVAELIPYASAIIGGWMAHSLGSVTSVHTTPAGVTEVSTSTGSIKIPAAYLPQPPLAGAGIPADATAAAPTETVRTSDAAVIPIGDQPTAVIDPNAKYGGFLSKLPSAVQNTGSEVSSPDGH